MLGQLSATELGYSPLLILMETIPTGGEIIACKC